MSFQITYKKLFTVNFYHHYFLDDGATAFDDNTTLKASQLLKYDFKSFLKVVPSEETILKLSGQKIKISQDNSGLTALINTQETAPNSGIFEPYISLAQSESLLFLLYVTDPLFENYSTIAANPEIPYLFSNKKPGTEGGSLKYIDLETTTNPITDFEISQTTYEGFFEHITEKERIGLFGILHLEMEGDDTTVVDGNARNILNGDNSIQNTSLVYKIQIANRSTIWNYIDPADNSLIHSTDPTELPLVKNGIIGYSFDSKERPSAEPKRLVFEKDGGGNIIKTISEIFIN